MQAPVYIELSPVNHRLKIHFFSCLEEQLEMKPVGTESRMNKGDVPEERKSFSYYYKYDFFLLNFKLI